MQLRRSLLVALVALGVTSVIAVTFVSNWTPPIPAGAASTVIGRAAPTGPVLPDPDPADPDILALLPSQFGHGCLERISNASGWLDLCWAVTREADLDPAKDYYDLRLYGTLEGDGDGVRWWVLRADPVAQVADSVWQGWPDGVYDGACQEQPVAFGLVVGQPPLEMLCNRTVGGNDDRPQGWQVTWQCIGCMVPNRSALSVVLYESVGVAQGSLPSWDIAADFGS